VACATGFAARAAGADEPKKPKQAKEAKQEAKQDSGKVDVGGRVLVRETVQSVANAHWTGEMQVASARLRARYDWKRLRAVVSVEVASGQVKLKDGFVSLDLPARFELVAGQFKMPLSPIENESVWSLPTVGRGLLSDVLQDSFHLTGRRPGFMASWRGHGEGLRPGLSLGGFQRDDFGGKTAPASPRDGFGLDAVARATLDWKGEDSLFELGVGGSLRLLEATPLADPGRYWAASVDAQLDHTWCGQGVRAWLEGFAGTNSSALDTTPTTPGDPLFVAARALAAWRRGGVSKGEWYIEPFALASFLDPNLDNAQDIVFEASGGVGGGQWKRWKLQLELEVWRKSDVTPVLQAGGADLADHEAVLVQLGAGF